MGRKIRIAEAAEMLGVSQNTLRRWDELGILVPIRTSGGHRRYDLDEVKKFIGARKTDVALYVVRYRLTGVSETKYKTMLEVAKNSGLKPILRVEEDETEMSQPLPNRHGFRAIVRLAADRKIGGFVVNSIAELGGWAVSPWLEQFAVLGLVCYYIPEGQKRAVIFPVERT